MCCTHGLAGSGDDSSHASDAVIQSASLTAAHTDFIRLGASMGGCTASRLEGTTSDMDSLTSSRLALPVVFVSERLDSRWQDLRDVGTAPRIQDLPSTRFLVLEDIWIVSTFLRLREAGVPVEIDSCPREDSINIVCTPRVLLGSLPRRSVIVSIRADRVAQTWGDLSLVQNPLNLDRPTDWLIDHWPQPNIIPRRSERGDRVERVGVIGPVSSMAAEIRDPRFQARLESMGFELVIRSDGTSWNDYSDLDVQLTYRVAPKATLRCKPATKIVQSWIARCPAITAIEPCFRAVGRSGVDYLEATSAPEIISHLQNLRDQPDFYRSLIECGSSRARSHDEAAVLRQWIAFLEGPASSLLRHRLSGKAPARSRLLTRASVIGSVARYKVFLRKEMIYSRLRGMLIHRGAIDELPAP